MAEKTKITLSSLELELVCNKEWILTKQLIIEKVYRLFGVLAIHMQRHVEQNKERLPWQALAANPKISRGENYRQLPYVILDYPRYFTKDTTLAIRTLFWWGNFFSINFHLSGTCKEKAMPFLKVNFAALQLNGYFICVNSNPWQHHFEEDNYISLKNMSDTEFATILHRESFIKIAKKIPLQQWDNAQVFLEQHFKEMVTLIQINFPACEKDPSPGIPITGFDL